MIYLMLLLIPTFSFAMGVLFGIEMIKEIKEKPL